MLCLYTARLQAAQTAAQFVADGTQTLDDFRVVLAVLLERNGLYTDFVEMSVNLLDGEELGHVAVTGLSLVVIPTAETALAMVLKLAAREVEFSTAQIFPHVFDVGSVIETRRQQRQVLDIPGHIDPGLPVRIRPVVGDPSRKIESRHGAGDAESLRHIAAEAHQQSPLRRFLDAFGDHFATKRLCQPDPPGYEGARILFLEQIAH